ILLLSVSLYLFGVWYSTPLFEIDYYAPTINHFYFIYSTHIHKMLHLPTATSLSKSPHVFYERLIKQPKITIVIS
ncbi:hypothetical protein VIGAN_06241400, partial [Vigna angularis var. angularis]